MLKALKADTFAGIANAKCGEVYFQSLNSYRIDCAFCDMKCFVFGDFLLHIENEHFENGLLKSEVLQQPKQEKLDSSPGRQTTQVNPFSWYEVPHGADPVGLAENSEGELIDETKQLRKDNDNDDNDEDNDDDSDYDRDPVDVSIMKWDRDATTNGGRGSMRHTRALKVDYKEEDSDMENTATDADTDVLDKEHNQHQQEQQAGTIKVRKEQLPCPQCNKKYLSKKTLQRHMERQHKQIDSSDGDNDNISMKIDIDVDAAADGDGDGDVDYKPPKLPSAGEYKCEHCDKVYQGKYTLRQHVKRDHDINSSEAFVCLECNAQLPRLRLLDEHVVREHGGAPCVICGRRYKTRHELKRHQLKHTNERNVQCNHPGCEKRFFTTRHMRNHIKVHSEQKNFVCESCGYSCRNKETLRVHSRSHTGERPFGCKVCDKRFPSHSGLREHMAMHSTERPHVCKVCGATFSRQKGLYHHKFLHTEKKQFVCKLCGNAYAQAAGLAGHMRKHRNDELNA